MKLKEIIKKLLHYFSRIFYWASGANYDILKQVPSEKNKYFGIGGTVIFTALMATFAGGYAFFTAFKNFPASIFFGIFWGSLIFNLDRYIVTTFGSGDGKKTISRQELLEATPRLIMAFVLGIVIATPLELRLFHSEIKAEIVTQQNIANKEFEVGIKDDPFLLNLKNQKDEFEKNIKNRNKIIEEKRLAWAKANKDKNDEWNFGKFSGRRGKGEVYDDLKKKADDYESAYITAKEKYSKLNDSDYERISKLVERISHKESLNTKDIEEKRTHESQNDGLLAQLKALDSLTSKYKSLLVAKWLITFLFILIEIAPILFKMMTERGPYDDILDRIKHEIKVQQMLLQSNLNQEINMAVKVHADKTTQILSSELKANKDILSSIATAQAEIAEIAIAQWKEEQKLKVTKDVNKVINAQNTK